MRAVSLHRDVIVVTSALLHVNCVIVRGRPADGADSSGGETERGGETFVVDSPVLPDELDALPALLEQARLPGAQRAAGHARRLGSPARAARVPRRSRWGARRAPRSGSRAAARRGAAGAARVRRRALIERSRPLALGSLQALPVPGRCEIGEPASSSCTPPTGHTADGMAIGIPLGRRAGRRRLPVARSRSRCWATAVDIERVPGDARAPAAACGGRRARRARPRAGDATAQRRARRSSRRTSPTCARSRARARTREAARRAGARRDAQRRARTRRRGRASLRTRVAQSAARRS